MYVDVQVHVSQSHTCTCRSKKLEVAETTLTVHTSENCDKIHVYTGLLIVDIFEKV